jgi:hypothetical protein
MRWTECRKEGERGVPAEVVAVSRLAAAEVPAGGSWAANATVGAIVGAGGGRAGGGGEEDRCGARVAARGDGPATATLNSRSTGK